MKKSIAILLALVMVVGVFAAVSAEDKPSIGVLIYKYDDTYISTVRNALTAALDGKADVSMQDGKGDQATQNDELDVMISKGVKALVVNMVDAKAAQGVQDKAKAAGIPTIFFNREPDYTVIQSYDKSIFIGTNAADAGKMQGDLIRDIFKAHPEYDANKDGKIQYVMFEGEPDNPEAIARTEWSVKQAVADGLTMEQIGETQVCNWSSETAQTAMTAMLAANEGKIELVIANNDDMAIGAIAALNSVGYNAEGGDKFIPVIGVDATDAGKDAIAKGKMSATVKQDGEAMGKAVAAVALNMAMGKDPLDGTDLKLTKNADNDGQAVRIPYAPYTGE